MQSVKVILVISLQFAKFGYFAQIHIDFAICKYYNAVMERLKELRKLKNLTMKELGQIVNVAESTISLYENGKREPDYETLKKLADVLNVSTDYLLGRDSNAPKTKAVKIPVLGTIPAGVPLEAIEEILDYEEISEDMASHGEYFALKVKGNSMLPTIKDGDVVIVRQQDDADSGKICVVMINGFDATLKEIKKDPQGLWVLPHNSECDFKPSFFSNQQVDEVPVRIIGVAVEIRRSL